MKSETTPFGVVFFYITKISRMKKKSQYFGILAFFSMCLLRPIQSKKMLAELKQ